MLNLASILIMALGFCPAQYDSPTTIVLTDVENHIYRDTVYVAGYNFTPDCNYPWYVIKTILHGGKQEGVEVIDVHNGKLSFQVIPTRGMSVQHVLMANLRLGWKSPVKGLVNPDLVNLMEDDGKGWLEGFTEWMVRCGLGNWDESANSQSANTNQAQTSLTLPGKIANTPASLVEVVIDRNPPYRLTIRGRVDEAFLHGPNLQLMTEISTVPGENTFQISDTVTNNSSVEQEFGILYHSNYSTPFMEKDARFVAPAREVTPSGGNSAEDVSNYDTYPAPTPGSGEQLYYLTLWGDTNNHTKVMLRNAAADKAVSMAFSLDQLACFTLWKNPDSIEDGYVTGLEPGTNYLRNGSVSNEPGRVPVLAPHESRKFTIDFAVLNTTEQVLAAADEIAKIKAARQTAIESRTQTTQSQLSSTLEEPAISLAELEKPNPAKTWEPSFTTWFGKPAPDFTLTDITGKTHKVSDYKGKNLILNFWATWCGPCRIEIPDFIELRKSTSEDKLAILGISMEKGETDLVKKFAAQEKMNYAVLVDDGKLAPPYSDISAIPTTFFIEPQGNIKFATIGTLRLQDMRDILNAQ